MTGRSDPTGATLTLPLGGTGCVAVVTTRAAGDLRPGAPGAKARRRLVAPGPWAVTGQVHGATVAHVGAGTAPPEADGLVARLPAPPLAMFAADCCLVGFAGAGGVVGVAHAGWQGLLSGVVEATADAMRALGAGALVAVRGPCIGPECYEFGERDLASVAARYGDSVRATTAQGRPALDLAAGVRAALDAAGVTLAGEVGGCTACTREADGSHRWYSHRARRETARHALCVLDPNRAVAP